MSLDAILLAIEQTGAQQVAAEQEATQQTVAKILAGARETAAARREAAHEETMRPLAQERIKRQHQTQLTARQIVSQAQEDVVTDILAATKERLPQCRCTDAYPDILRQLVQEALSHLKEDGVPIIIGDRRDADLLHAIRDSLKTAVSLQLTLTCWGGVVVTSEDGRVIVDNTLQARFQRARPRLRQMLAQHISEGVAAPAEMAA